MSIIVILSFTQASEEVTRIRSLITCCRGILDSEAAAPIIVTLLLLTTPSYCSLSAMPYEIVYLLECKAAIILRTTHSCLAQNERSKYSARAQPETYVLLTTIEQRDCMQYDHD